MLQEFFSHESMKIYPLQERDPLDWEDDKFPKMSERDVGIPRGLRDSYWKIVVMLVYLRLCG